MIPKKIMRLLGYNNLSVILEQERRHWLLKTDNKKQIQDKLTGDIFQGQLDNIGSDVIIESRKLPYKYDFTSEITFGLTNADKILTVTNSAFPHSAAVNGFMFARITSTNFPYVDGGLDYNHYKLKFTNAVECILPFGASTSSSEVYADRWIKTTTPPTMLILDKDTSRYTISRTLTFAASVTNPVWYYPLSETLQPFTITDLGHGEYELDAVDDDGYIGYPLFWFTCDQSNVGSNLTFDSNNINARGEQIFFAANEGNATAYNAKVYTGLDGTNDATPDGTATSNYKVRCSCGAGNSFNGSSADFNKQLSTSVVLVNDTTHTNYTIEFVCNPNDKLTMSKDAPWVYNTSLDVYEIELEYFDQNCLKGSSTDTPLVSIFDIHFDESVPFVKTSTDVGLAGVRMGSANLASDIYERYPYNLNKWEGLPEWMNELDANLVPEHLVMYAFHQPPTYDPDNPESMQGAGLILDPGKPESGVVEYDENDEPIPQTDNIGRVYVLSNDDIEYHNNAKEQYPKPARTAARICDIPTSIAQLSGAMGISSTPIIDDKYVRTEASYTEVDKDKLYNKESGRWVRPTALTANGQPVWSELGFPEKFAFPGINTLLQVDLINYNDFREWENLNPEVDVLHVSIRYIHDAGSGYAVSDVGECIVGGYAFTYQINEVDDNGAVLSVDILPPQEPEGGTINIANLNLIDGGNTTDVYGTTPTSGTGSGLKISFVIDYDYFESILPKKGEIYPDLFAFVKEQDGLYQYQYEIYQSSTTVPKTGAWRKMMRVSEFEVTSIRKQDGGIASNESYINSMIPSLDVLPVIMKDNNIDPQVLEVLQTASFINIIDKSKTPVVPAMPSETVDLDNVVDMCKYYCDGIIDSVNGVQLQAADHTEEKIREKLQELNLLRFDSYVLWRWKEPTNLRNNFFEVGIVHNGFNNLFTTDTVTKIPSNELRCDNFVNTNGNTTIVWDVPGIGVMMWVYDPTSTEKENYYVDPETMDLHISREPMTYDKIDVRTDTGSQVIPIVEDERIMFNVMSNNPVEVDDETSSPIYQQPEMTHIINANADATGKFLHGNWKLVFPRVNSYTLRNDETHTQFIPKRMQVIKGRNIPNVGAVYDKDGNDISMKNLVIDEAEDGIHLRMFNSARKKWEEI